MIRVRRKYLKNDRFDIHKLTVERKLLEKYGLRNKKQIAKTKGYVQKYQRVVRSYGVDSSITRSIVDKLVRLDIIKEDASEINGISVENFLDRRLQSLVAKQKGITCNNARQLITHGHVLVGGVCKRRPSYLIRKDSVISYK